MNDALEKLKEIPKGNLFFVGMGEGGKIIILSTVKARSGITREEAVNLSLWLMALANPSKEDEDRIVALLEEIRNS